MQLSEGTVARRPKKIRRHLCATGVRDDGYGRIIIISDRANYVGGAEVSQKGIHRSRKSIKGARRSEK